MNKIYEPGVLNKIALILSVSGVVITFLSQEFTFVDSLPLTENQQFILRKTLRVVLNDFFMLVFIAAWFKDLQVVRLAIFIQIIDGLILLPIYLYMKLLIEGNSEISSPLLSQLHRLIINPTLMILLIPAIYFQKLSRKR